MSRSPAATRSVEIWPLPDGVDPVEDGVDPVEDGAGASDGVAGGGPQLHTARAMSGAARMSPTGLSEPKRKRPGRIAPSLL